MLVPSRHILTEQDRQRLLADIAIVALTIGRELYPDAPLQDADIEALSLQTASGTADDVCPRERLAFLVSVWRQVENALHRIEAMPDTQLETTIRYAPVERARRASPKALLFALSRPAPHNNHVRRVPEHIPLPTTNTPANRLIKTMLMLFLRDMQTVAQLAAVSGVPDIERQALRLRHRLRATLRREPWRTLLPLPGQRLPPLPQSVWQNAPYRFLYDLFRRYHRGFGFDWENPLFTLPSRETWRLYEYWCFFQVADALRSLGFRAGESDTFTLSRSGLTFALVRGRASTLTLQHARGQRVTLTYNRTFPQRTERHRDGWYSRSHTMQPDIVLETAGNLLVLDAKFKTYADRSEDFGEENLPLTADINQCHAYRDGILWRGESRVQAAWLLYPGQVHRRNQPIIAYGNGAWSEVGALLLRPGGDRNGLSALLEHALLGPVEGA